ncbi:hypothetical protein [Clostridium paraputrificum]|uniref:Uncharacterized protein n=1 Tax=Clostridium paraputrificum TaxID=29363 RepID=A0A6N3F6Y7_9CLOT
MESKKASRLSIIGRKVLKPFTNKYGVAGNGADETTGIGKLGTWLIAVVVIGMVVGILFIATKGFGGAKTGITNGLKDIQDQVDVIK